MSKKLDKVLSNLKLSDKVLDEIAEDEVKRAIGIFTNDSKMGIREITYEPRVRDEVKDVILERMIKILSSKGFYCLTKTEFYYGYKYLFISVDKISKFKRFLHKIGWL